MIPEIDQCLERLIRRDAVGGRGVQVAFETPTRDWATRQTGPVINIFLYDIREDLQRRDLATQRVVSDDGRTTLRRTPPRRFALSYLLTAWTQSPQDEHLLLSDLLGALVAIDRIPEDLLSEPLVEIGLPVVVSLAMPPNGDRSLSDVWTALGGEPKPSLDLQVIAPFVSHRSREVGPPVREAPRLGGEGGRRRADPTDENAEVVHAGTDETPGRTMRLRRSQGR